MGFRAASLGVLCVTLYLRLGGKGSVTRPINVLLMIQTSAPCGHRISESSALYSSMCRFSYAIATHLKAASWVAFFHCLAACDNVPLFHRPA